jgi:hypothetical protein
MRKTALCYYKSNKANEGEKNSVTIKEEQKFRKKKEPYCQKSGDTHTRQTMCSFKRGTRA